MAKPLAQQYVISKAVITSDYKTNKASIDTLEVTSIIAELMIEETIMRPYTTGKILLVDQNDVLRQYRFRGSERITISFSPAKDNNVEGFTRTFIMMGREAVVNNDAIVFNLIEESGYLATTKIISQAYTGTLPEILAKIVKTKLGKDLKAVYQADATLTDVVKRKTHIVVPQLNAWDTVNWLASRMSTASGTPYFISASLYKGAPVIWSLEQALSSNPFNRDPFIYSDVHAKYVGSAEVEGTLYAELGIQNYTEQYNDSIHKLEKACSLAGITDVVDTNTNLATPKGYNLATTLQGLVNGKVITRQAAIDDYFTINDQNIAYTPSAFITQATSGGTYLKGSSYSDDTDTTLSTKLSNKMLHNVMLNNSITADMSGKLFAASGASVGSKIRMHFDTSNKGEDNKPKVDIKLSGDYIITGLTHHFGSTEYNVTVQGAKFHDNPDERKV